MILSRTLHPQFNKQCWLYFYRMKYEFIIDFSAEVFVNKVLTDSKSRPDSKFIEIMILGRILHPQLNKQCRSHFYHMKYEFIIDFSAEVL